MTNHKTQWNYFGDDQVLKSRVCLDKHKGITFKINSVSIFYFDCEYVIPTLEDATIRVTYACFLFFLLFYHYFAILLHFFFNFEMVLHHDNASFHINHFTSRIKKALPLMLFPSLQDAIFKPRSSRGKLSK
jgi:hypothetical protein